MLFIELDEGKESLADMEYICQQLLDNKEIAKRLDKEELEDISYILKPSLAYDHNEDNKRKHWSHMLETFSVTDNKGHVLRFYREPRTQRLYFGNQEGFDMVNEFISAELERQAKIKAEAEAEAEAEAKNSKAENEPNQSSSD